jgi:hypothetical protein
VEGAVDESKEEGVVGVEGGVCARTVRVVGKTTGWFSRKRRPDTFSRTEGVV